MTNIRIFVIAFGALALVGCAQKAPLSQSPAVEKVKTESLPSKRPDFGLPKPNRQKIFAETVGAEKRATREADSRFSYDLYLDKNLAENERLSKLYRRQVQEKFALSDAAMKSISREGIEQHWPPLAP